MDTTIVIRINEESKLKPFLEFLKSIDYISSVEYFDKFLAFKQYLEKINDLAASTALSEMTLKDINEEVKAYRSGK